MLVPHLQRHLLLAEDKRFQRKQVQVARCYRKSVGWLGTHQSMRNWHSPTLQASSLGMSDT